MATLTKANGTMESNMVKVYSHLNKKPTMANGRMTSIMGMERSTGTITKKAMEDNMLSG